MNFSNEICLLCLENHDELIEIYGKQGIDINVGAILEEHFWFEVGTFPIKQICQNCWKNVESFHIFYNSVKEIHQQQAEPRIEQDCETKATIDNERDNELVCSIKQETIYIKVESDDFTNILDSIDYPSSGSEDSDVDSSALRDPPIVPRKKRKYTRKILGSASAEPPSSKCKRDIHTPLLSQYFNMTCDLCETKLLSYQDTKNHYRKVHDIDGYLICCNTKYMKIKQMLLHCEWHTKQTDSLLSQVSASPSTEPAVFKYKTDVYTPLLSQYFNMACDLCETKVVSYRDTRKHFRDVHPDIKDAYLICCNRKYKSLPLMLSHCEWHVNPDAFKCGQCSKTFRDKQLLGNHLSHSHRPEADQIFNCYDCGKNFPKLYLLKQHLKSHDPSYKCSICQKRINGKIRLRHHIRDVHSLEDEQKFRRNLKSITKVCLVNEDVKKFVCDICGCRYQQLSVLRNHIKRLHCNADRNVQLHICEICAKPFKSRGEYKIHYANFHTNASEKVSQRCQCDKCGSWLKNKQSLFKHFQGHKKKPATCTICGRVYRNIILLRGHIRTTHRKPSLECVVCGSMSKTKQLLKEHMAIHAGITDLYSCEFCPKTCRSNANMYTHRKRCHPAELEKLKKTKTVF